MELQKDEMYLPGNLGTIQINGKSREVKSFFAAKDGSVTITIGATKPEPLMIDGHKTHLAFYSPEKQIELPSTNK